MNFFFFWFALSGRLGLFPKLRWKQSIFPCKKKKKKVKGYFVFKKKALFSYPMHSTDVNLNEECIWRFIFSNIYIEILKKIKSQVEVLFHVFHLYQRWISISLSCLSFVSVCFPIRFTGEKVLRVCFLLLLWGFVYIMILGDLDKTETSLKFAHKDINDIVCTDLLYIVCLTH